LSYRYHQKIVNRAHTLLKKLFDSVLSSLQDLNDINILVIGAGTFPSLEPLVQTLARTSPNLKKMKFYLVEPEKFATDLFEKNFMRLKKKNTQQPMINVEIHNSDIKNYLKASHHKMFDLVYFEHPDISYFQALFYKVGLFDCALTISLCESIPYLRNVLKPKSILFASCMFKTELTHLASLLSFSLPIGQRVSYKSHWLFDGGLYGCGLIGQYNQSKAIESPKKLSRAIQKNNHYYFLFVLISALIFLGTLGVGKIVSMFFVFGQLFYHRYGMGGISLRIVFIIGQLLVLIGSFMV